MDRAQLATGLELLAGATELLQRDAEQSPEMALYLSTLLIELGKFQLLLDSDGQPRDATGSAAGAAMGGGGANRYL
eukprot:COSAG03_NODE_4754_length_1443_cov_1.770089_2_plen_76_part_00